MTRQAYIETQLFGAPNPDARFKASLGAASSDSQESLPMTAIRAMP